MHQLSVFRNPRPRKYEAELQSYSRTLQAAGDAHPLSIAASNLQQTAKAAPSPSTIDPLRSDPLSSDPLRSDPLQSDPLQSESVLSGGSNYSVLSTMPTIGGGAAAAPAARAHLCRRMRLICAMEESHCEYPAEVHYERQHSRSRVCRRQYSASSRLYAASKHHRCLISHFFALLLLLCCFVVAATQQDRVKQRLEELDTSQAREQAVQLQMNQAVCACLCCCSLFVSFYPYSSAAFLSFVLSACVLMRGNANRTTFGTFKRSMRS